MKQSDNKPQSARNWSWPEKTWFRERLNAVKARERETQQKPEGNPRNPVSADAKPGGAKPSEESEADGNL